MTDILLTPDARSPEKGANIPWRQGDTVTGHVEQVADNGLVRLMVRGQILEALSEVQLSPGQRLSLYVSEVRPGYVRLRVLVPESDAGAKHAKVLEALQQLNMRADDRTVSLAIKLIQTGLPVTRENLTRLFSVMRTLGDADSISNEEIGLWIVARKGELSPEQILALRTFLTSTNNAGLLLTEADQLLERMAGIEDRTDAKTAAVFARETVVSKDDYEPPYRTQEALTVNAPKGDASQKAIAPVSTGRLPDFVSVGLPVLRDAISRVREAVMVNMNRAAGFLPVELYRAAADVPQATRALAALEVVLAEYARSGKGRTGLEEVLDRIKLARRELEGQQVFNLLGNQYRDNQQVVLYMALPVLVGQEFHLCELKVMKEGAEKKEGSGKKEAFTLALSLTTSTLGLVLFHLTCYPDRHLVLNVVSEDDTAGDYLRSELPELVRNLEALGFAVDGWEVKVVEGKQQGLRSGLIENERMEPRFGIDIVV